MSGGSKGEIGPVVSAAHLAAGAMPALSELEFALNVTVNAYHRWMVRCSAAAGIAGLTATEVLVLHQVNHRGREKTLADLCLVMNVEDTHLINYAVKKLVTAGLVQTGKRGKEKTVAITKEGEAACARYHELREALLVKSVRSLGLDETEVSRLAGLLRALSGQYDQAARAAASL
ncbi:MAG: winged helix DNA-binding protein [Salaquimonas sp.]|jgi:predicted MarR family transcription regulator|nr:winged helix DNA-binding protein [Salaquimonas sp.]